MIHFFCFCAAAWTSEQINLCLGYIGAAITLLGIIAAGCSIVYNITHKNKKEQPKTDEKDSHS